MQLARIMAEKQMSSLFMCVMVCLVVGSFIRGVEPIEIVRGVPNDVEPMEKEDFYVWSGQKEAASKPLEKPKLDLPKEEIRKHIKGLKNYTSAVDSEDREMKTFGDEYLTTLVNDDYRPIPLSKRHSNRVVLDRDVAKIPNVVHFVNFNQEEFDWSDYFTFARYVTFKSVEKYLKPALILIWGDNIPWTSKWWNRTVHEIPNIYYIFAPPVFELGSDVVQLMQVEHKADWLSLNILKRYGGIFLDNDVIVLRPFTDLMNHTMVMGRDTPETLSPGVILTEKESKFTEKWVDMYNQYKTHEQWKFAFQVLPNKYPSHLAANVDHKGKQHFPIEVLPGNFTEPYPKPKGKYILYCGHYNLKYNYVVHMYQQNKHDVPRNFNELKGYNCTLGNAMRKVLFGDTKLLNTTHARNGCKFWA